MTDTSDIAAQINAAWPSKRPVRMGNDPSWVLRKWPTGVLPFDYLMEGGLVAGRITEVFGDYSTLKTYIATAAIASVQALGGRCALLDTEHSFDQDRAKELGVNTDALMVQQPETAEDGIGVMEILARAELELIVWDSIAASQPKQYAEAKPGEDLAPAALARVLSRGLNRLNTVNQQTTFLCLNQTRINVGMTYGGSKEAIPGGKAPGFYASQRVRLTKAGKITQDIHVHEGEKMTAAKRTQAQKIKATLEKSRISRPYQEVWFLFDLETGTVDNTAFLLSQGLERGLITETSKGGYFRIPNFTTKAIQGKPAIKKFINDRPEVMEWLATEVMGVGVYSVSPGVPAEPAKRKVARRRRKS